MVSHKLKGVKPIKNKVLISTLVLTLLAVLLTDQDIQRLKEILKVYEILVWSGIPPGIVLYLGFATRNKKTKKRVFARRRPKKRKVF